MNQRTPELIYESCSYCGQQNQSRLAVCPSCGTALVDEPHPTSSKPKRKSKAIAFWLAFIFGPLGLFYATVRGGLFALPMGWTVIFLFRVFKIPGGLLATIITHFLCAVWAFNVVKEQHEAPNPSRRSKRLLQAAARLENVDRLKAIVVYNQIVKLFPGTPASTEAARNIETLKKAL